MKETGGQAPTVNENSALGRAFGHAPLRDLLVAWALSNAALWAWAVTIATVAFQQGGAPAVALALAARLIPGAISAPFAAVIASRMRGLYGLITINVIRVCAMFSGALVLLVDAPISFLYLAVIIEGIGSGPMHALHIRLLPLIARTPDELAIANSLTELLRAAGLLVGPFLSAMVLYFGDALQAMLLCACLLLVTLPLLRERTKIAGAEPETFATTPFAQVLDGALVAIADTRILILIAISALSGLVTGSIQLLITAVAIDILGWRAAGPSVLICLVGLGGIVGGAMSLSLADRKDLSHPLALGLACIGAASIFLGVFGAPVPVIASCVAGGVGLSVLLVMLNTLFQKTVALPVQAAVFGLSAFLQFVGIGMGGGVGSTFVQLWGLENAAIIFGAGLVGTSLVVWVLVRSLVADTGFHEREYEIVRQSKPFRNLTVGPSMQVAACLQRQLVETGEVLVKQGERGDEAYLIGSGRVKVIVDGTLVAELGPGDVFGEIALLKDAPRTATIVSATPAELWKLNRDAFLYAVNGTPDCHQTISSVAQRRLKEIADFRNLGP